MAKSWALTEQYPSLDTKIFTMKQRQIDELLRDLRGSYVDSELFYYLIDNGFNPVPSTIKPTFWLRTLDISILQYMVDNNYIDIRSGVILNDLLKFWFDGAIYMLDNGCDSKLLNLGNIFYNPELYQNSDWYDYFVIRYNYTGNRGLSALITFSGTKRIKKIMLEYNTGDEFQDLFERLVDETAADPNVSNSDKLQILRIAIRYNIKKANYMMIHHMFSDDISVEEKYNLFLDRGVNPFQGDAILKMWLDSKNIDIYESLMTYDLSPNQILRFNSDPPIDIINYVAKIYLDGVLFFETHGADMHNLQSKYIFMNSEFYSQTGAELYKYLLDTYDIAVDVDDIKTLLSGFYQNAIFDLDMDTQQLIIDIIGQLLVSILANPNYTTGQKEDILKTGYEVDRTITEYMIEIGYPTASLNLLVLDNDDRQMVQFIENHKQSSSARRKSKY